MNALFSNGEKEKSELKSISPLFDVVE